MAIAARWSMGIAEAEQSFFQCLPTESLESTVWLSIDGVDAYTKHLRVPPVDF